jgi:hypothetical protein
LGIIRKIRFIGCQVDNHIRDARQFLERAFHV